MMPRGARTLPSSRYPAASGAGRRFPAMLVRPLYEATGRDPRVAELFVPARADESGDAIELSRAVTEHLITHAERLRAALQPT